MNRGIFFVLAGVGITALLVILGWMELNREATDAQLVKAAMDQIRPSSSPSRVPLRLVSSKVNRMNRDRGVIHITVSMPRQVDRRVGDRDVIEAIYGQSSPDNVDGPILNPPRLKPTGTLTVTLSCEFAIQRESIPVVPWLGALKARSVVLWPDFSEPEAERQFIDQLKDMVDKGEMDNAVHDLLRIRKNYYLPTPRDYYRIRHGLPPDYREIDLLECRVKVAIYRRDWTRAMRGLKDLREEGGSSSYGRDAIRRCEGEVREFYRSLSASEKSALRKFEGEWYDAFDVVEPIRTVY